MLEGSSASVAAKEAQGGTRHARWTKLLGSRGRPLLKAAAVESPGTVVIQPFLESHYNQCQPYNDYAPVYDSATDTTRYRGRCPCGCVATATAQVLRHFRWPARIDRVDSFDHKFTNTNNVENTFPLRFDGHLPIDWAALEDKYDSDAGGEWIPDPERPGTGWQIWKAHTDLRGTVQEATHYPIARLIMFSDVLAQMSFKSGGSSSDYDTVAGNMSEWYVKGNWVNMNEGAQQIKADIMAGVPCHVSIGAYNENNERYKGHQVIAHGWAESDSIQYLCINFGWGGSNDGYYNLADNIQEYQEKKVYVGHYPRAKPQIDPLPKVCGTSLKLNWHFPDFYTNNLSGFTVSISRPATTPSTFLDDFSESSGTPSSDLFAVGEDNLGYDGNLLYALSNLGSSYFTFPEKYTLTSASVLTFKLRSYYALGNSFEVQARFNDGDWITILEPALFASGDSGWVTERVYLGEHGGETVQLRLFKTFPGGSYYPDTKCILVDDFTVTDVLVPIVPETQDVGKEARSLALNELEAGATYSFTVTPNISDALVSGETSEPVSTVIAGTRQIPIPWNEKEIYLYETIDTSFSTTDNNVWSYSGNTVDGDPCAVSSDQNLTITANGLQTNYVVTAESVFSFDWAVRDTYNYLGHNYDLITVSFVDATGTATIIDQWQNSAGHTRTKAIYSLSSFAGQKGMLKISVEAIFVDVNSYYSERLKIYAPKLEKLTSITPVVPHVALQEKTFTALGAPEIRSVLAVTEGFYAECGTNATAFTVQCSPNVETLRAFPSHLSLVRDEDVTIYNMGNGAFTVSLTPSGINETNFRSRMILTLAATDDNGTTTYKDLSLRFAPIDVGIAVTVNATTSSGTAFSVDIPYVWIETNGLVPPGSAASAYEAALVTTADADGDGIPNWAEYVCGTCPTNSSSKLTATISIDENGTPIVGYDPSDGFANGFKAIIKGTNNLSEDFSKWQVTTETKDLHFYRVEIIPE